MVGDWGRIVAGVWVQESGRETMGRKEEVGGALGDRGHRDDMVALGSLNREESRGSDLLSIWMKFWKTGMNARWRWCGSFVAKTSGHRIGMAARLLRVDPEVKLYGGLVMGDRRRLVSVGGHHGGGMRVEHCHGCLLLIPMILDFRKA